MAPVPRVYMTCYWNCSSSRAFQICTLIHFGAEERILRYFSLFMAKEVVMPTVIIETHFSISETKAVWHLLSTHLAHFRTNVWKMINLLFPQWKHVNPKPSSHIFYISSSFLVLHIIWQIPIQIFIWAKKFCQMWKVCVIILYDLLPNDRMAAFGNETHWQKGRTYKFYLNTFRLEFRKDAHIRFLGQHQQYLPVIFVFW